jgi:transposase
MSLKSDQLLAEVSKKIDVLIRLSALNLVKDIKKQKDQIALLSDSGFQPKQIADILRTTSNTVSVALNAIRKERGEKEGKKTEPAPKKKDEIEAFKEAMDLPTEKNSQEHGARA